MLMLILGQAQIYGSGRGVAQPTRASWRNGVLYNDVTGLGPRELCCRVVEEGK